MSYGRKLFHRLLPRRTVAAVALAALLAGPDFVRADEPLMEHDGARGVWLRSETIECFVALQPRFRILSIRKAGGESILATQRDAEAGVRLAYMTDQQVPTSFDVGNQPAEIVERDARAVRLRLAPAAGLQYAVHLSADPREPVIHLDTQLANVSEEPKAVACWTVIAFARGEGMILVPFGAEPRSRRRLVISWYSPWPQSTVHFGRDVMVADTGAPIDGLYKLGVITSAGWIAMTRGRQSIMLYAPYDPAATYPEDGANVTLYQQDIRTSDRIWCEIEQVGPQHRIAPGQSTPPFRQRIHLVHHSANAPEPTTQPGQNDLDKLRLAFEASIPASATQPSR